MKRAAFCLISIFCGLAAAQVPASGPATEPATLPVSTQPQGPATVAIVATTGPATASTPMTAPSTMTTSILTPTTLAATTAPTTNLTPTTLAATTAPTTSLTPTTLAATTTRPGLATTLAALPTTAPTSGPVNARSFTQGIAPATLAAALPVGPNLAPRPISVEYRVLLSRSIFIRGRQQVFDPGNLSDGGRRIYSNELSPSTTQSTQPDIAPSWSPENTLVFNGASDANGQMVAFVENTALNSIARFQVGDAIASGKVAAITLDQLDYAVGPRVTHVMLGQNLSGVDMQVLTTQPVTATTGPAGLGSTGGADDVLERLRRRRLQELGGK